MEKTAKYIVFRDKKTGSYLQEYNSRGTLACKSEFSDAIEHATVMRFESFEQQRKRVKALAKALNCEIIVVEATYNLKYLNGEDAKEVNANGKSLFDVLNEIGREMGLNVGVEKVGE